MSAYRVALILCRAVAIALAWSAGVRLVSGVLILIAGQMGVAGLGGLPLGLIAVASSLATILFQAFAAIFLRIFSASLASAMTGGASFEGESIAPRQALDATERALARAGAGLSLLFFSAPGAIPPLLTGAYFLFESSVAVGATGASPFLYSIISNLLPTLILCVVGFVLAFRLGLQRLIKSPSR